ncbi:hypothetical protein [Methylomonas koyamae]|uniref:hypothetical protein n=1 Tax=Methylomonas koyamae TaxID=702114 RepID=UPI0006D28388|nr:hypothetical protein [Methylomonas koyamae]BBL58640.1 hypothetical protein MKFW12EY_22530 [Methylomonas koyamae]
MANKPNDLKPSDFSVFAATVYAASATMLEFEDYFETYEQLLRMLWWNPEVDLQLAIESNPSGVSFGEFKG